MEAEGHPDGRAPPTAAVSMHYCLAIRSDPEAGLPFRHQRERLFRTARPFKVGVATLSAARQKGPGHT